MHSANPSTPAQALGLLLSLALTFLAAALGSLASVNAPQFYAQLVRPSWAPPGWLFGPVWSALYTLMAVAAWLAWRKSGLQRARPALMLYAAQLAANALWSWLFFQWQLGNAAFAEVLLLWGLIAATALAFWRLERLAAWLLLPYWLWVGFASALSWATWQLNPALLGG